MEMKGLMCLGHENSNVRHNNERLYSCMFPGGPGGVCGESATQWSRGQEFILISGIGH
jgi:hypothetical protein